MRVRAATKSTFKRRLNQLQTTKPTPIPRYLQKQPKKPNIIVIFWANTIIGVDKHTMDILWIFRAVCANTMERSKVARGQRLPKTKVRGLLSPRWLRILGRPFQEQWHVNGTADIPLGKSHGRRYSLEPMAESIVWLKFLNISKTMSDCIFIPHSMTTRSLLDCLHTLSYTRN